MTLNNNLHGEQQQHRKRIITSYYNDDDATSLKLHHHHHHISDRKIRRNIPVYFDHSIFVVRQPKRTFSQSTTTNLNSVKSIGEKQQIDNRQQKMAKLLSGKEVSDEIRAKLREQVTHLSIKPTLAIIQVGGREDSNVYIRMKKNFAESIGGNSIHLQMPRATKTNQVSLMMDFYYKLCLFN